MKSFAAELEVLFLSSAFFLTDGIQATDNLLHIYDNRTIHLEGFYQMLWLNCKRYFLSACDDLMQ
jgi:hypothetical protein